MFTIKDVRKNSLHEEFISIENSDNTTFAKIYTTLGASLQELVLNGKSIITDVSPLTYANTYASSLLFPFANRIKDGTYQFDGKMYQFPINESGNNNALHGLVYNKTFQVVEQHTTETSASIKLQYIETKESAGFPYTYTFQVEYILSNEALNIHVEVKNTDTKPFPFTVGWHPYFASKDLYNSTLNFDSDKKLVFDVRCITQETAHIKNEGVFEVKDKQLDDCFILNTNQTQFNTPEYKLLISATSAENFLQIYTPPKKNTIAIEPTTGVSNSFNNKMGLQTLKPNTVYTVSWEVKLL
mgnify:FL=1